MKKILIISALAVAFSVGFSHISNSEQALEFKGTEKALKQNDVVNNDVYLVYFNAP